MSSESMVMLFDCIIFNNINKHAPVIKKSKNPVPGIYMFQESTKVNKNDTSIEISFNHHTNCNFDSMFICIDFACTIIHPYTPHTHHVQGCFRGKSSLAG